MAGPESATSRMFGNSDGTHPAGAYVGMVMIHRAWGRFCPRRTSFLSFTRINSDYGS